MKEISRKINTSINKCLIFNEQLVCSWPYHSDLNNQFKLIYLPGKTKTWDVEGEGNKP